MSEVVTVDQTEPREEHYQQLEKGNILLFPRTPFALSEQEREVLRGTGLSNSAHHKNIAYRPAADKVTGCDQAVVSDPEKLRGVMRAYSQRVLAFIRAFLPRYMAPCAGRSTPPPATSGASAVPRLHTRSKFMPFSVVRTCQIVWQFTGQHPTSLDTAP